MTAHLEFCHVEFGHIGFSHHSISSQTHSHLPRLVPTICTKKISLIHSDLTCWWQASVNSAMFGFSHFAKKKFSGFILTWPWWWQPSWILPSRIQPFCTKKILSFDSDSTWWWQPSVILPCWIQPFCTKKFSHSFWLDLMMAAILNSAMLNLAILDSAIIVFPLKLTPTCQVWFPLFAVKNFTHSFWLNLMMAAILNSAMLDSDTTILVSDTLLSSLRLTSKPSHSTLTLTQTNSIWP